IAYKRLITRSNIVNDYEINRWQPGKVIKILADLADEGIIHDSIVRVREQAEPDIPELTTEPVMTMEKKGLRIREIEKVYNSLGSLLHIKVPTKSGDTFHRMENHDEAIKILSETIEYVAPFESGGDFFMNQTISVSCWGTTAGGSCNEVITRPEFALEKNPIVSCTVCRTDYEAKKDDKGWNFQESTPRFPCGSCGNAITVPIADIAKLKRDYERQGNPLALHEAASLTKACSTHGCKGSVVISLGITFQSSAGEAGGAE
ncbi:MAG: hypothetical protein K2Q06_16780, partial [Parvularculaceae bacterium]|nr:hypothetical protein [Parvularculaceae bacterium]